MILTDFAIRSRRKRYWQETKQKRSELWAKVKRERREHNTQAEPPHFFRPVDFFSVVFLGPAVDDVGEEEEDGKRRKTMVEPRHEAAHVYQIAGPDRWGGLWKERRN